MSGYEKWTVFLLSVLLVFAWSAMFYSFGVSLTEGRMQTEAVERGYAEWVLPEHPHRQDPVWRWIEPKGE